MIETPASNPPILAQRLKAAIGIPCFLSGE
jgi:hypothetical protein